MPSACTAIVGAKVKDGQTKAGVQADSFVAFAMKPNLFHNS